MKSRWLLAVLPAVALAGAACHTITEQAPTSPTGVAPTAPTGVAPTPKPKGTLTAIAIPVILPKPTPTPAPAPTPTPAPAATPAPPQGAPPASGSCSLPASSPSSPRCTDDPARLFAAMDTALTRATQSRPELFNTNNKVCDNCYYVKNVDAYVDEVIRQLNAQGVCAEYDGEEMAAKRSNDFSEQYDILLASGHMRRGAGMYRGVCAPAIF